MTKEQDLKTIIVTTAAYYGAKLMDSVVLMHAQELEDIPFERVKAAFDYYRRESGKRTPPLPSDIRAIVLRKVPADQQAAFIAGSILEAIGKYGYTNHDKAKAALGKIAWEVVKADGGWLDICRRTTDENIGTVRAQWRQLAQAIITRGPLEEVPLSIGSSAIKQIGKEE